MPPVVEIGKLAKATSRGAFCAVVRLGIPANGNTGAWEFREVII